MYKIFQVNIDGFWGRINIGSTFNADVNIIIGENGTGKTTFMNILHAVLAVDIEELYDFEFTTVEIILVHGKKKKKIKVTKIDTDDSPFLYVEYKISTTKHIIRCFGGESRMSSHYRRRAHEESYDVRNELENLVSLASLSVYRNQNYGESEQRDRSSKNRNSPVDERLSHLMERLTRYQLELSQQAREVSSKLQKDVLISLLYKKEKHSERNINFDFHKENEINVLVSAYNQLDVLGTEVQKRIKNHVEAIHSTITQVKFGLEKEKKKIGDIDFAPIEAYRRTSNIVDMSLKAEKETNIIFGQVNIFWDIIKRFIKDKSFSFIEGDLVIESDGIVPYEKLSSGEKQLLILLIEALLQKKTPFVFLADEPELSLHISWQRMIIPAITELNPNAQVIVATHSPEIAGNFKSSIIDMKSMRND